MNEQVKPMKKTVTTKVNVSRLYIEPGFFITITFGSYSVEVICKDDGTLQVCADDETLKSGIHRYKEIYGPDPFKEEAE